MAEPTATVTVGFGTYTMLSLLGTGPIYLTFEREAARS